MEDFWQWLGEQTGAVLRFVVELLAGAFTGLDDFFSGLAQSLGMSATLVNGVLLLLGVYLLFRGVRRLMHGAIIASLVRLGLAVLLLGWLIN